MASMLNMQPTPTQSQKNSSSNSQNQTHYKTAYGAGSFLSSNTLSSQTNKNLNNNQENSYTNIALQNNISSGGSRIKVAVRVRPLLENEKQQGHQCTILKYSNNQNEILIGGDEGQGNSQNNNAMRAKSFKFDQVITNESTQSDLYNGLGIQNMITKVIEGYHSTIFAYGQTGSGKTFTMEGYDFVQNFGDSPQKTKAVKASNDSENIGITQRSIFELFNQIQTIKTQGQQQVATTTTNSQGQNTNSGSKHYSVFVSFLQIYNEKVFDLLNSSSINSLGTKKVNNGGNNNSNALEMQKQMQGLRIRWTKKDQFVVENLYVFECQTPEEAIELFRFGSKNRILASHNLNDLSSRSHTIFTLTVEQHDIRHAGDSLTVSKLQLVDLAGSEKQGLTGTTGVQAKESIDINKSLLVLRKVITALTEQKGGLGMIGGAGGMGDNSKLGYMTGGGGAFIPYRESKLTCLLKQSLGGNSYTLMIACLSPSDKYLEENLSTLNYAAKASLISNIPTKNIDPRLLELNEYKKKIQDLEKELRNANDHIQFLTQMNDDKAKKLLAYEQQFKQIQSQDPQLIKNSITQSQQQQESQDNNSNKLPSIQVKNQVINTNSHNLNKLKSEIIQSSTNTSDLNQQSDFSNLNPQSINITSNDIDLSINNPTSSAMRSLISPTKSTSANNNNNLNNNSMIQPLNTSTLSNFNNNNNPTQQVQLNTKRQTQMNFFLQKDKEKQDAAAERLIHSVNAVTDLLKANTELRETIEKLKNTKEEVDSENFNLSIENQSLRERLELVEGILKNNRGDLEGMVSDQVKDKMLKSNTQYGKFNMNATLDNNQPPTTIDAVYTELIQLRHKNKALEGRIKQLEIQNFRITNTGFNKGGNSSLSNNPGGGKVNGNGKVYANQEPLRPMFRGQSSDGTPINSDREMQSYHVQEEDNEDEDDDDNGEYDDEEESDANNNQPVPSSKSRSFIVTIDEHNPGMQKTGLIKKRIIKKNVLDKQKRNNQTQIVMARGDPYLKKLAVQQNITPGKQRDPLNTSQLPPTHQQNSSQVPDQRYYTKTNFFTINQQQQQDDNASSGVSRTFYNQSAISNSGDKNKYSSSQSRQKPHQNIVDGIYNTNYNQNSDNHQRYSSLLETSGGAVQPPKQPNQLNQTTSNLYYPNITAVSNVSYESDFGTINDINRRKGQVQLEPINEQLKNVTDVEFKNYQKSKKKQLMLNQGVLRNANHQQPQQQQSSGKVGDLSMVMVMSNMISKRSGANLNNNGAGAGNVGVVKKKSQSQSATNNKKNNNKQQQQYINNEFYF